MIADGYFQTFGDDRYPASCRATNFPSSGHRLQMTHVFSGAGPGTRTSDGCSVELYRDLPYLGELDDIIGELQPGASALELGCGTGRLTRPLIDRGLSVTAVDNSAEMLSSLPSGAKPVFCDIGQLNLTHRFDIAILASCLINHPDLTVRASFLASARRHLGPSGRLFLQRHDPNWLRDAPVGEVCRVNDSTIAVETVARRGNEISMTIRYDRPMGTWWHSFAAEILDDAAVERDLLDAGFEQPTWHGRAKRWLSASVKVAG